MIRKITLGITLFFSTLMFACGKADVDWEKVGDNVDGVTFYVDFDRIRTNGGYVYSWELQDYLEPNKYGTLSGKVYYQGDCEMFRLKILSVISYKQSMGEGSGNTFSPPNPEWLYPPPNSAEEETLKRLCKFAENL